MKKMVLCGLSATAILFSGSAFAGPKWGQWGIPMAELDRGFERIDHLNKYESMQYGQPTQWERVAEAPLPDLSKLYKSGILKDQYINWSDQAILEVGTNFYHLSSKDMASVLKSFDTVYNYTKDGKGYIQIRDARTREEVGTYGAEGLFLQ